jgi:hypothetical protein
MPIYVYETINDDPEEVETFEIMQKMSDEPLTAHPLNGKPCRRVITAPNFNVDQSPTKQKKQLSNENLGRLGFTKYEKSSDGYVKTAGKGPDLITKKQIDQG